MSEYYGVTRSDEYLAHYGIKGMKWGVKRAKESGNEKALARHYKKAQKKYNQLSAKADVDTMHRIREDRRKDAPGRALMVGLGTGIATAARAAAAGSKLPLSNGAIGSVLGMAAYGVGHAVRQGRRGSYLSVKGHERAVAKRDNWKKEMGIAFKDTKYDQNREPPRQKKHKRR